MSGADSSDDQTRRRDAAPAPSEETRYRGAAQDPGAGALADDETRFRTAPEPAEIPRSFTGETGFRDAQDPLKALRNVAPAAEHGTSPAPRSAALQPGVMIRRRYVLERLIGSGGMGQVWRARDLVSERARDPNPFVALKLLNADFESDPD
ncbi:MAG TPA: hypothetical protein VHV81_01790, partial [Steroidobacteraceae bacterium]|nr:hypothetical protein [Steroidobacteraceae bacterium]